MNVTFRCTACDSTGKAEFDSTTSDVACPHCQQTMAINPKAIVDNRLERCLVCPSKELFVRKNFPQGLGVSIVVVGFILSSVTWYYHHPAWTYAILFATAFIDVVLYLFVGDLIECYRCHAQYRGLEPTPDQGAFDLEIHERHRQEKARLQGR
ncbi:MAG: hypothetical protein KDA60_09020 [Planctomycetales bacterium]|nr:hypothetical protein [Planctomycetales bacterium]